MLEGCGKMYTRYRSRVLTMAALGLIVWGCSGFCIYCLCYALPKTLKENYPDLIPLSDDYWDRTNLPVSLIIAAAGGVWVTHLFESWQLGPFYRKANGLCKRCEYDLTGIEGRCPECGAVNEPSKY